MMPNNIGSAATDPLKQPSTPKIINLHAHQVSNEVGYLASIVGATEASDVVRFNVTYESGTEGIVGAASRIGLEVVML